MNDMLRRERLKILVVLLANLGILDVLADVVVQDFESILHALCEFIVWNRGIIQNLVVEFRSGFGTLRRLFHDALGTLQLDLPMGKFETNVSGFFTYTRSSFTRRHCRAYR